MTINCKGQLIDVSLPKVMGILNVTPDSFFDGGKYKNESEILKQVEKHLSEGLQTLVISFITAQAFSVQRLFLRLEACNFLHKSLPL